MVVINIHPNKQRTKYLGVLSHSSYEKLKNPPANVLSSEKHTCTLD